MTYDDVLRERLGRGLITLGEARALAKDPRLFPAADPAATAALGRLGRLGAAVFKPRVRKRGKAWAVLGRDHRGTVVQWGLYSTHDDAVRIGAKQYRQSLGWPG